MLKICPNKLAKSTASMAIKSNFKKKNITFSELSTYASKTLLKKN
jgi:hypothetical protein